VFVVPPPPANEAERLDFLVSCGILDTPQDERFDRLTRIASRVYGADVAFLSFVDDRYQWMKAITIFAPRRLRFFAVWAVWSWMSFGYINWS